MNDTPQGKPRFLSEDPAPAGTPAEDAASPSEYSGRFLSRDSVPPEEPTAVEEPEIPDVFFEDVSEPAEDAAEPESPSTPEDTGTAFDEPAPEDETELPAPEALPGESLPEADSTVPDTQDPLFELLSTEESLPQQVQQEYPELTEDEQDFQELFNAPEEEAEAVPPRERPASKGRPKNRKKEGFFGIPNILVTLVWIAITLSIGVTLGRMLWVCAADVLAFGRKDQSVTITIYASDTIDDIAQKLHNANLVRYPGLFKLYAKFAVDDGEIQPGIWDLNTLYDYHALVKSMSPSSSRDVVTVMIPEGSSCRQIFELLQQKKVCTVESLSAYAASGELEDYWFLEGVQRGDKYCLEGYLFPDTYEFYTNDSPANVLQKMLNNFEKRLGELDVDVATQLAELNSRLSKMMKQDGRSDDYIAQHQFTLRDMLIVASLIEKETASAEEGYTIASVIYNRLFSWGSTPAYLNIDAAIIYALDGKTDLTAQDLQVDSPYNTYTHVGLTPGPITNPGLSSIKAALKPSDTDYYYYVLDPETGVHHFSRTLDEHEAFRAAARG